MNKNSKIFVAGHKGLLGSAIYRQLIREGYTNVKVIERNQLDLTNQFKVNEWFKENQPNYVFLSAAKVAGIEGNNIFSGDIILENLQIQTNVIKAAWQNNCYKLLFAGSNCVYPKFPGKIPITEDLLLTGALEPLSEAYAVAKIAGIKLCQHLKKQYNFNAISIMPCNLYGINDSFQEHKSHVMAAMISKFVLATKNNHAEVKLWGDGSPYREFLYCDDVASAAILCMLKYDDIEPINVASGNEITLKDLANIIKQSTGFEGKILWDNTKPSGTPRKGLDISKLKKLGWQEKINLEKGIPLAVQWYKNNLLNYE